MGAFRRLGRKYGLRLSQKLRDWFDGRPASAPTKLMDLIFILAEASVLIYSETIDKWPLFDLVKAILFLMFSQDNVPLASVYGGNGCKQLEAPKIIQDLGVPRLLELCLLLSKKPFPEILHSAGFSQDDVLVPKTKARIMKPSFAIVCDVHSKCFLVLIRGTRSIRDVLTDATCAAQSFECSVLRDDGTMEEVSGHVHKGMVGAAREIAKECTPILLKWLAKNPNFKVKVVGHSLGGGTAALLTYILRGRSEFSSSTCVTFGPAACMTLSLAESGKHFITTIINGSDLVPTFSTCSVHDLLSEVITNSSQLTGSTRRSRARIWVDRLGDILKQIVSDIQGSYHDDKDEKEEIVTTSTVYGNTEDELCHLLQKFENKNYNLNIHAQEEEADMARDTAQSNNPIPTLNKDNHCLYPPGRIIHIVPASLSDNSDSNVEAYLYETPRELYGKIRLSKSMIKDHSKTSYKKMIEQAIHQLEKK